MYDIIAAHRMGQRYKTSQNIKVTFCIRYFFLIAKQDLMNLAVDLGVSLKTNINCSFDSKVWNLSHFLISE